MFEYTLANGLTAGIVLAYVTSFDVTRHPNTTELMITIYKTDGRSILLKGEYLVNSFVDAMREQYTHDTYLADEDEF